jgi:hypothetical protein
MKAVHTFNEAEKRFEPTEKICQFCGMKENEKMENNYFVPLFKEQDRTNIVVYRSVKYSKLPIGIPRCADCQEIHYSSSTTAVFISLLIGAGIFVMSVFTWGVLGVFAFVPAIFVGVFGKAFIEDKLVRNKGILTKLDGAKENETVQEFVIHGWSFNQPAA